MQAGSYQYQGVAQPQSFSQPGYGAAQPIGQQQFYDPEAAEKAAKKQLKQQDRLVRREKRTAREQAEGTSFVKLLCAGTLFTSVLTTVTMFGNSWATVSFVGAGVKMFSISTSLFTIDVDIMCGKNWLEDQLCSVIQKMHGRHSIHDAQQLSCAMTDHACSVMDRMYYASFIIFFFHTVAIICNLCAALFLYYYWNGEATEKVRQYALRFFFFAPFSMLAGTAGWSMVCPDLGQLPMAWTHATSMITGGHNLFGYTEVPTFPFGWCWTLSWIIFVLMSLQLMAWACCFREHQTEDEQNMKEELDKLMMGDPGLLEDPSMSGYSQASTAPTQYGTAQPYNAGSFQNSGATYGVPPGGWK